MTLACEDAYSKLVDVVTVAYVDEEDRVGNSLLHSWELVLANRAKLLLRLSAQDLVKVLKLEFGNILQLMFGRGYEVELWSNC